MKKTPIVACVLAVALVAAFSNCSAKPAADKAAPEKEAAVTTEVGVSSEGTLLVPKSDAELRPGMTVTKPTIIDFNADWCGPCRMFAPAYDLAAASYAGNVDFYSVNVDRFPQSSNAFGVQAIPTIVIILPDGTTRRFVGVNDFIEGLDPDSNPSTAEITNTMYTNLSKILDGMIK